MRRMHGSRFARLSDLGDCQLAGGQPDPRGWHVVSRESTRPGEVADLIVDVESMTVRYIEVELDKDALFLPRPRRTLVPADVAWLNDDEDIVRLPVTAAQLLAAPSYEPRALTLRRQAALRRRYAGYMEKASSQLVGGVRRRRISGAVEKRQ